jgi:hypothetical protein
MIGRIVLLATLWPFALWADSAISGTLRAWFRDGTCIEFATSSSGSNTPTQTSGSVITDSTNTIHRVIVDAAGNVVFAYDVEASRIPNTDEYQIRIRPVPRELAGPSYWLGPGDRVMVNVSRIDSTTQVVRPDGTITVTMAGQMKVAGQTLEAAAAAITERLKPHLVDPKVSVSVVEARRVPTVSAPRNFPPLRPGMAATLEMLRNPSTGEKIVDVLRPLNEPPPSSGSQTPAAAGGDGFVLGDLKIAVDGHDFAVATGATLTGASARIYLPGIGAYYLALDRTPGFVQAGRASREKLWFEVDGKKVEIAGKGNVLRSGDSRAVWVKFDARYRPKGDDPREVHVTTFGGR